MVKIIEFKRPDELTQMLKDIKLGGFHGIQLFGMTGRPPLCIIRRGPFSIVKKPSGYTTHYHSDESMELVTEPPFEPTFDKDIRESFRKMIRQMRSYQKNIYNLISPINAEIFNKV